MIRIYALLTPAILQPGRVNSLPLSAMTLIPAQTTPASMAFAIISLSPDALIRATQLFAMMVTHAPQMLA
jgi:hypothetical protein